MVLGVQRQAKMELEYFQRLSDILNVNESTTSEFSTINAKDIKALRLGMNMVIFKRISWRKNIINYPWVKVRKKRRKKIKKKGPSHQIIII